MLDGISFDGVVLVVMMVPVVLEEGDFHDLVSWFFCILGVVGVGVVSGSDEEGVSFGSGAVDDAESLFEGGFWRFSSLRRLGSAILTIPVDSVGKEGCLMGRETVYEEVE